MWLSAILASAFELSFLCSSGFAEQSGPAPSQGGLVEHRLSDQTIVFQGDISAGDSQLENWTVELIALNGAPTLRTRPRNDGFFQFPAVMPGEHEVRLLDERLHVAYERIVSLRQQFETISIRLQGESAPQDAAANVISLQQLRHKIPHKAMDAFKKGNQAFKKGEMAAAADRFQAAVELDPAFAEAYNDLGAAYYQMGKRQPAVEAFQKAVDLAPGYAQANDNLCIVLFRLKRYSEAAQAAERILKSGSTAVAHYVKAVTSILAGGNRNEALDHLWRAQDAIPEAHLVAAGILADEGKRTDAAHELEEYLRLTKQASVQEDVQEWLATLK